MTDREILFGRRITRLRHDIAELESDIAILAGLHTYSAEMDKFDLRASVRCLEGATEAARTILTKLEQNRS